MPRIVSGGGINSNKVVHAKGPKVEPKATAISPGGVNQAGVSTAFKKTPVEIGRGYEPKAMGDTGIANARQGHAGVGPGGGGRTIYKSGSQSPTPSADGMPTGRDTLSEYGKDWKR